MASLQSDPDGMAALLTISVWNRIAISFRAVHPVTAEVAVTQLFFG
jgi:hypothetical protein